MKLRDHLGKLEYFCAVVETGSLKKASQKALVGQPQLSKVIQQLEQSLGAELFIRSHRGVKLTSSGQQLYEFAMDVLNKSDEVELDLKASDLALSGRIRFGTYDSISRYFFPDFLKYIKKVAPKLNVDLETGRSEKIRKKVLSGEIDIAVIVGQLTESRKMKSEVIYSDSFGLYQASGLDDYFSDHLIYFPSTEDHSVFEKLVKTYKFKNKIVCDNLETVKSLTEEGIGVGLIPHRVARESLVSRKISAFDHPKLTKNSLDTHSIILCHQNFSETSPQAYLVSELKRFLQIWSKN